MTLFRLKLGLGCFAALLLLAPLATPLGLVAGVCAVAGAMWFARREASTPLKSEIALAASAAIIVLGYALSELLGALAVGTTATLWLCDAVVMASVCFGLVFAVHFSSERHVDVAVIELAGVFGAIAFTFISHRHHHIEHPRFLSDWAWSHGIDPVRALEVLGGVALLLAVAMMLRTSPLRSMLAVVLVGLLTLLIGHKAIPSMPVADSGPAGSSGESGKKDDDGKGESGGSSGGSGRTGASGGGGSGGGTGDSNGNSSSDSQSGPPPPPVAVLLLKQDLSPDLEVFYLRQAVMSRLLGDRMVEDKSGAFDKDVLSGLGQTEGTQSERFHQRVPSSVFLLVDHAQFFGLGHPFAMRPLRNPNPAQFKAAYDVDSYMPRVSPTRLLGRDVVSPEWTSDERTHYLAAPEDTRYKTLSDQIVRDVDPRFVADSVMYALAIKEYLEKNGVYNSKRKTLTGDNPTAQFLFGDLHGYCVHFAHAATLLLRSQHIPARVAIGYGVQTRLRGAGSAVMVMADQAHAWPEIFVDGVGWVTFDVYPQRSDDPLPQLIDTEMENILGEIARADKTGGKGDEPPWEIPTALILAMLLSTLLAALLGGYLIKIVRRSSATYRGVMDRLSEVGGERLYGESREAHARRMAWLAPSFAALTREHLRLALGHPTTQDTMRALAKQTRAEIDRNMSFQQRVWALLNPFSWLRTK